VNGTCRRSHLVGPHWRNVFGTVPGVALRSVGEAQPEAARAPVATDVTARRFQLASPATATVLGVLVLVLAVATAALKDLVDPRLSIHHFGSGIAIVLIFTGVGVVVARRQPRNPIGWILVIFTTLYTLGGGAGFYAVLAYGLRHRGLPFVPVAVLLAPLLAPSFALFPLVIVLFPDGRLASRRWRWVLWAYAGLVAYLTIVVFAPSVAAVAGHDIRLDMSGNLTNGGHLAGSLGNPPEWLVVPAIVSVVVIGLSFVAHQVLSWRRAAGERRQQLKWLASGAAIAVVSPVLAVLLGTSLPLVGIAALPVSIGVAILKYRLYEIDRIISRTLAYAIVTGLLVGVYAVLVLLATQVLSFSSPVAVAASTLVAAALFSPLRRRVQRAVDRRFDRARYDGERLAREFGERLRHETDLAAARAILVTAAGQAMQPRSAALWIRERAR
jgi:hypothetical protein